MFRQKYSTWWGKKNSEIIFLFATLIVFLSNLGNFWAPAGNRSNHCGCRVTRIQILIIIIIIWDGEMREKIVWMRWSALYYKTAASRQVWLLKNNAWYSLCFHDYCKKTVTQISIHIWLYDFIIWHRLLPVKSRAVIGCWRGAISS